MKRLEWAIGLGVLAASLTGCGVGASGSGARGRVGPVFPSQASLKELAGQPVTAEGDDERKTVAVDEWELERGARPTSEADALVERAAGTKGRRLALEPELGCAAREIARFYAAHGAFPDQQLQAYLAGACGSTAPTLGVAIWSTPSETVPDAANQRRWHDGIAEQLGQWLPDKAGQAGAAQLSDGKNDVFAAVVAVGAVSWEQKSVLVNEAGEVELTGRVRTPAAFVYGMTNVGAHGFSDCRSNPRVAAPRFHLTCKLGTADQAAWVDVQALPPGRVLSRGVARLLIRREGAPLGFTAPTKNAPPESVSDASAFAKRILALVNDTRASAQLRPLQLATRESETSARLAPHYFRREGSDDAVSDRIALGLLAGWDVQGTIRTGDFYSNMLSGSLDPKRWLAFVLDQPSARRVLLDPDARSIAIGPDVRPQSQTVGALINTYAFYESDDHSADVKRFVSQLNAQRRGLGLPPAKLTKAPELVEAVLSVKTSHDPEGALQTAMQQVVNRAQHDVEGIYIEVNDLDHVTFPDSLLRPSVTFALSATHHRYPGAAWGTLTLLIVVLDSSGPQREASMTQPPPG